jgi:hypothetical protein
MARTLKDRPAKLRFPEEYPFRDLDQRIPYTAVRTNRSTGEKYEIESWFYLTRGGTKTKKKRKVDTKWHWLRGEPRWWRNSYERKNRTNIRQRIHRFMVGEAEDVLNNTRSCGRPFMDYWW